LKGWENIHHKNSGTAAKTSVEVVMLPTKKVANWTFGVDTAKTKSAKEQKVKVKLF